MGIDIREGLQMACIGCGLCVDACNDVMERTGRQPGLIDYDSVNSTELRKQGRHVKLKLIKAKTVLFGLIFCLVASWMLLALANKPDASIVVLRGRDAAFTLLPDGSIRNVYVLKIQNKTPKQKLLTLTIEGLEGLEFMLQGKSIYVSEFDLLLLPEAEEVFNLFIKLSSSHTPEGERYKQLWLTVQENGKAAYKKPLSFFLKRAG